MNVHIEENQFYNGNEVIIRVKKYEKWLNPLVCYIEQFDRKLLASQEDRDYYINLRDIWYIESIDGKTLINTEKDTFIYKSSLSSIEKELSGTSFCRIRKNALVNIQYLKNVESYKNHRLLLTLTNGEKLLTSRAYLKVLKEKLIREGL